MGCIMTDDYMSRLLRDLRLSYSGDDFANVVDEFERETKRVIREHAALVVITPAQAIAPLMMIHEMMGAIQYYRERQR